MLGGGGKGLRVGERGRRAVREAGFVQEAEAGSGTQTLIRVAALGPP